MMRFIRDLRFIPIALIASACLLVLKIADLVLEGGYLIGSGERAGERCRDRRYARDAGRIAGRRLAAILGAADVQFSRWRRRSARAGRTDAAPFARAAAADRPDADITGTVRRRQGRG